MSNEEIIQEILLEAEELRIRHHVLDLSQKLRETNPRMSMLESMELALNHFKNHS
jgi:hypothetical protein